MFYLCSKQNAMKRGLTCFLLLLTFRSTFGQTDLRGFYAIHRGKGLPSLFVMADNASACCSFRDEFCTKELMRKQLSANLLFKENALLCEISHWGWSSYGELDLRVGYARQFGNKLAIALRAIYLMEHASHYAARHSFTIDFSATYQVTSKIGLAVALFNPIHLHYAITGPEIIPMKFTFEINYQPNNKILGYATVQKTVPGGLDIALGLYYHPISPLILQGECSLTKCGVGFHIPIKKFIISVQTDWYFRISFSPECNFHYLF